MLSIFIVTWHIHHLFLCLCCLAVSSCLVSIEDAVDMPFMRLSLDALLTAFTEAGAADGAGVLALGVGAGGVAGLVCPNRLRVWAVAGLSFAALQRRPAVGVSDTLLTCRETQPRDRTIFHVHLLVGNLSVSVALFSVAGVATAQLAGC